MAISPAVMMVRSFLWLKWCCGLDSNKMVVATSRRLPVAMALIKRSVLEVRGL